MPVYGVDQIITIFTNFRISDYTLLAGTVIWFYDILLTLDDELTLLWTRGGGFIKVLYLINRYLPVVGLPLALSNNNPFRKKPFSARHHLIVGTGESPIDTTGVIVATTIFMVRIYTIFCFDRKIRVFLVLALVASHICMLTFTGMLLAGTVPHMIYSDVLRTCMAIPGKALGAIYATPIFVESVIAFATLYHAWSFQRAGANVRSDTVQTVVQALYIDGFLYYLLVLCLRVGSCLVYYLAPKSLLFLLCYLEYAFTSTITSRWFLSFRKVLIESFSSTTIGTMTTSSKGKSTRMTSGVVTGASFEFNNLGPHHGRTRSTTQDPSQNDTFLTTRDYS
ncbi:hypothetical protein CPB86DRAFT_800628 [Serendipita vermifera]|nr:hypothetical protein CPB86DRAFT_800628 [Serendipita vermifera]